MPIIVVKVVFKRIIHLHNTPLSQKKKFDNLEMFGLDVFIF